MKDLTEVQVELRRLSAQLEALARDVEDMRPKEHSRAEDYAAIQKLAQDAPIANTCLRGLSEGKQTAYLRLVCTAAGLDGELTTEQLIYLCRLSTSSGCPVAPGNLSVMAYQTEYLDWQAAATDLRGSVLPLLLDILLTIHQGGRDPERGLSFTAELAALLGCGGTDLAVCAQLASALLTADFEAFRAIPAKRPYPQLRYAVPDEWLKKASFLCGKPYQMENAVKVRTTGMFSKLGLVRWMSIKARETARSGDFVTAGTELVCYMMDPTSLPEGISISDFYKTYEKPELPPPILAAQDGFVYYILGKNNTREVWINSAFG